MWAGLRVGWGKSLVGPGELCGETLSYEGLGMEAWVESPRGGNPEAPGRLRPQGGRKNWENRRKSEAAIRDGPGWPRVRSVGPRDLGTQTHPRHAPDPGLTPDPQA